MKKLVITVVSLLCMTPLFAFEPTLYTESQGTKSVINNGQEMEKNIDQRSRISPSQFGFGVRAGMAQNDPKDLEGDGGDLKKRPAVWGLDVFYETNSDPDFENSKIGIKLGADWYGKNELSAVVYDGYYYGFHATETSYAFPLTLYYKKDKGVGDLSFLLGVGFTLIYSRMELEGSAVWPQKFTETKMFPHVTAGAEYRFSEQFALGLDIKYNINAKVEKVVDGEELVLSDRSGLGAALTGRFYF